MKRPRLTIGGMMVAVAIAGLICAAGAELLRLLAVSMFVSFLTVAPVAICWTWSAARSASKPRGPKA